MELGQWSRAEFEAWFDSAPLFRDLHTHHFAEHAWLPWREALLEDLHGAGAIAMLGDQIIDRP